MQIVSAIITAVSNLLVQIQRQIAHHATILISTWQQLARPLLS